MKIPFFGKKNPGSGALDELARLFFQEVEALEKSHSYYDDAGAWRNVPSANKMVELSKSELADMIALIVQELAKREKKELYVQFGGYCGWLRETITNLNRRKPQYTLRHLEAVLPYWEAHPWYSAIGVKSLVGILEEVAETEQHPQVAKLAERMRKRIREDSSDPNNLNAEYRLVDARLAKVIDPSMDVQNFRRDYWEGPLVNLNDSYGPLLDLADRPQGAKAASKWRKEVAAEVSDAKSDEFLSALEDCVQLMSQSDKTVDANRGDFLRGLIRIAGTIANPRASSVLGDMVLAGGHKLPGIGARSQKGFCTAVTELEHIGTIDALAQLAKARAKIKTPSLATLLEDSMYRAANEKGISIEELEEIITPTFDLDSEGRATFVFDSAEARLRVAGSADAEVEWFSGGKPVKSVPASVKKDFAGELADLRKKVKQIESSLSALKLRIEGMMLSGRTLPYNLWLERYVNHPLVGQMSRRLIWSFESSSGSVLGMFRDGKPVDADNQPIPFDDPTRVKLWHPIGAGLAAIEVWRDYLFTEEITQPFKQAFREIYLLTDAERRTGTYSNRFAAHLIKQHQFSALARQRGWAYNLMGFFDSYSVPTLRLRQWNMSAEFLVEVVEPAGGARDEDMTDSGIALLVATDQVRFLDQHNAPIPLEQVPAILFSEAMRDVDLFVGVASVGADPAWTDQGERYAQRGYWHEASFGDLGATALTRKAVLERLLPRLGISSVSRLDGKFLVVKGELRTYKIHLGSGNILMEPNDQYLCIVRGGKGEIGGGHFIPFEGDATMSIILSKAFLLAADDKITDATITRQIRER